MSQHVEFFHSLIFLLVVMVGLHLDVWSQTQSEILLVI